VESSSSSTFFFSDMSQFWREITRNEGWLTWNFTDLGEFGLI